MVNSIKPQTPLYYGWIVISVLALTQMIAWGILYYAFSVMLPEMAREFGWGRGEISAALTIALITSAVIGVPVGIILDRYGTRALMTLGSIGGGLLVVAWANVQTLPGLYLTFFGIGIVMAALFYESAFAGATAWFKARRQLALTVITFGGGLASVVFVPLAQTLTQMLGWRTTLLVLAAVLTGMTLPLHALLLRKNPAQIGSTGDTESVTAKKSGYQPPSLTLREAVRQAPFWWLTLAFTLITFAAYGVPVHLVAYLLDRGYSPAFAAGASALIGVVSLTGRLIFTPLGAVLPRRLITIVLFLSQMAGILVLILPSLLDRVPALVYLGTILFGLGYGAISPARASMTVDLFGSRNYASISGGTNFPRTFGGALSPLIVGILYTATGDYIAGFGILALAAVIGTICTFMLKK